MDVYARTQVGLSDWSDLGGALLLVENTGRWIQLGAVSLALSSLERSGWGKGIPKENRLVKQTQKKQQGIGKEYSLKVTLWGESGAKGCKRKCYQMRGNHKAVNLKGVLRTRVNTLTSLTMRNSVETTGSVCTLTFITMIITVPSTILVNQERSCLWIIDNPAGTQLWLACSHF